MLMTNALILLDIMSSVINKKEDSIMQMIHSKAEFDAAIAKGTCFIDFYATWCGPCKRLSPILEELASEYNGQINFYKIDVDKEQELAAVFGIQSIPMVLLIPKEGKPYVVQGLRPKAELKQAIDSTLIK